MYKVAHRINDLESLKKIPKNYGIELDIRYHKNELILHHEPFNHQQIPYPESFEKLLKEYKHQGPLILNIKTEGIEKECISLMAKYKIDNWFFLDMSMPYFAIYSEIAINNRLKNFGPANLAVRFSEREPIEYALAFKDKAKWVWVDCFTKMPLDNNSYKKLKDAGFQICLVSPELQKHSTDRIADFKKQLIGLEIDAVCTKRPDLW